MSQSRLKHVVIIGGGFGGLRAAQALAHSPVNVTVVDRGRSHVFQPLLYQVATGSLAEADITAPLAGVLRQQKNARVITAEVIDIDPDGHRVILDTGEITYDTLIVASGVSHHYFGHDEWEAIAPGLKTIEDARAMRGRIMAAFHAADATDDLPERRAQQTFVIVGGGPTGVELAGALGELAHRTLRNQFHNCDTADS